MTYVLGTGEEPIGAIEGRRVLVTGGAGFLGSYVRYELQWRKPQTVIAPRSAEFDLRRSADAEEMFLRHRPEIVIHLAATVGGIGLNMARPADLCGDNLTMGTNLIRAAAKFEVNKFVLVGTACSYPLNAPVPIKEASLHDGYPEPTNAPYGLAKRMLIVLLDAYRRQYGLRGITIIPANLYGPGDHFDEGTSHVIPALIRKAVECRAAGLPTLKAWGTGKATRDFLYARDAARGIVDATEHYEGTEPVNLGTGQEVSIREAAELICEAVGYHGVIEWDASRPDGQPRRCLDASRAEQEFGWRATTAFRDGIQATADWYCGRGMYKSSMG